MREDERTTGSRELALLMLLGFLWGIPYALTKISLATIPPVTMVAGRVSLAAIALWVIVFASKRKLPHLRDFVPRFLIQGCLTCIFPYTLLAFGQGTVDSSLAAILNSTTPLFVCLISLAWTRHETFGLGQLIGVSIGLAGVIMIAGVSALSGLGQSTFGQAAIILATGASAAGIVHGRRFADVAPEVTAAGTLTAAMLVLVPLCFIVEAPLQSKASASSIAALVANGLASTAFGFVLYFRLIRTVGSVATSTASYLKPAVGALIGCTLMGESLTWTTVVGLIAILTGVAAINRRRPVNIMHWFRFLFAIRAAETN
jgi:drug/metabolite transporter (DMT)-like permease